MPLIATESRGHVALIRLARPEKRNALSGRMLDELHEALREPPAETRAIVLAGEGSTFCSGFDLELCKADPSGDTLRNLLVGLARCIGQMKRSPAPIVLAAHGAAIAGGCALLGGADVVVGERSCKLGYPVVRIGVSPAVSAPFLRHNIGDGNCRERLLDTALISGARAAALGLVHELVENPQDVLPRAMMIAEALSKKGPGAIAETKRLLVELETDDVSAPGAEGLRASLSLVGGKEERERLAALPI